MSASQDIAAKWQELKNRGLDLGSATDAERDAGYGGRVQRYHDAAIYWHADVWYEAARSRRFIWSDSASSSPTDFGCHGSR